MKRGFSLVELSIVLVILGLLVGGILAGQSLIRASELRSISADFSKYSTAIYAFRDKYLAKPGDMTNATNFWNTATNCSQTTGVALSGGTCNGDGNGNIGAYSGFTPLTGTSESTWAWQQLAFAGLIEGTFNGGNYLVLKPGSNVPLAKISNGYYTLDTRIRDSVSSSRYPGYPDTSWHTTLNLYSVTDYPLSSEEAWNIDMKMDDGTASGGKVVGYPRRSVSACSTSNTHPANYDLASTGKQCNLLILVD